ncbi:hypothetical protein NLI96_g12868 [Meripilus lineatus]|uniref:Uncharacterized protein n=1 Tax=Meripilus lineatus TaxID=2056292 RepID=A0AAD5UQU4_9APHY|nr:hypothetical protein NLI96_g12868 [Physisporinus lineatus]
MSSPLALDAIQRLVFDTKTKDSDIRRCSVKDLEHVCRVRAIVVVPTGKRGAIKADYIAAIVKKRATLQAKDRARPKVNEHTAKTIARQSPPRTILVQLLGDRKDWRCLREEVVELCDNGDVDLRLVARLLDIGENCLVIDPRNLRPYYQYVAGKLEAHDLKDLTRKGILKVTKILTRVHANIPVGRATIEMALKKVRHGGYYQHVPNLPTSEGHPLKMSEP